MAQYNQTVGPEMLPKKDDPRWRKLMFSLETFHVVNFSTKMMLMRVKMLMREKNDEAKLREAIDVAYEFFKRNEDAVAADIRLIFNDGDSL